MVWIAIQVRTRPFTPIAQANLEEETVLQDYRNHVEERAAQNIPPKPLNAEQVAGLVDLLKNPPAGEGDFLLELLSERVPPGAQKVKTVVSLSLKRKPLNC